MTIDSSPFKTPESELGVKQEFQPTFSNLNFWRKLYLVLMWLFTGLFLAGIVIALFMMPSNSDFIGVSAFQIIIVIAWSGLTYWHHTAIVKRKLTQLTVLIIINLIPFFNIIGALIMLSIRRVTKKELEMYDIKGT